MEYGNTEIKFDKNIIMLSYVASNVLFNQVKVSQKRVIFQQKLLKMFGETQI